MGTRFTRVTVIGPDRQVDISLPADTPLATQMPAVLRLLSVPPSTTPVRWRLAGPEFGTLAPGCSLADAGVLDGATLHLTAAEAAPAPPLVDDVESEVARSVRPQAASWSGQARRDGVALLLLLVLLGALGLGLTAPAPVSWWAPAGALVTAVAGAALPGRVGWWSGLVALPSSLALVYGVAAARPGKTGPPLEQIAGSVRWAGVVPLLAVAGAGAAVLVAVVRRTPGLLAGGAVVFPVACGTLLADRLGMPAERTAGLVLMVAVALTGSAGQLALGGAGLVPLLVADEAGRPVLRRTVRDTVARGLALTEGVLWGAAIIGSGALWELLTGSAGRGSGWVAPVLGLLGALVLALRSRMFTRARHVVPGLAAAVVGAVATAFALPGRLPHPPAPDGVLTLAVLAGTLGLLVAGLTVSWNQVAGARLARWCDRLELVGILALMPGIVLLFRVIPTVRQWWS